jgi:hypothetical protein
LNSKAMAIAASVGPIRPAIIFEFVMMTYAFAVGTCRSCIMTLFSQTWAARIPKSRKTRARQFVPMSNAQFSKFAHILLPTPPF